MRLTTYAYPWDLARMGVDATIHQVAADGFQGVNLASTYHPIDSLSPRGETARLFTDARGAVYFPARSERYGRIRPSLAAADDCAAWPAAAERAHDLGLAVSAWTVTTFQPWILDAHPDTARVLASGDPTGSGVCPANPDVREYVAALCADLVEQFRVDRIHLEGILQPAFDFDWMRPRVLVRLPRLTRELLALCFCRSCVSRGEAEGLDVDRLRRLVGVATSAGLASGESGPDHGATDLADDDEVGAFVELEERAAIEMVTAVKDHLGPRSRVPVSSTTWTPFATLLGASEDRLLGELATAADEIVAFPGFFAARNRRITELGAASSHPLHVQSVLTRLSDPESDEPAGVAGRPPLAEELREAADLGADEIAIYNYGLHHRRDVVGMVEQVRAAFG